MEADVDEFGDEEDDDPEPPNPAALPVSPVVRCAVCQDTGRAIKLSVGFAGQAMEDFCTNCTTHYDFATHGFMKLPA